MMENSGSGAATEDRIAALEKKMRDMEALVKGLTGELLDLWTLSICVRELNCRHQFTHLVS